MGRRPRGERYLGPYRHPRGWRAVRVSPGGDPTDGARRDRIFATRAEAEEYVRLGNAYLQEHASTVGEALAAYRDALEAKGNKPGSISTTMHRLSRFFPDEDRALTALHQPLCRSYYEALTDGQATDTHRNTIAEARSFLRWCVGKGWLASNPLDGVEGVGRRRRGKAQLRIDEARRWIAKALELARTGDAGAVAALVTLLMGLRASEIVERQVRDLDDDGRLLWIPDSKTEAGRRTVEVPAVLRPLLVGLARGRPGSSLLFGRHWRDWPRECVQRICRLAEVPSVTAHGMRGLHSSLAVAAGIAPHAVAASLGHEDFAVTAAHYARPEAVASARGRRTLEVLEGGRSRRTRRA